MAVDLKTQSPFKDVEHLVLTAMNVQWRGVAVGHAMLDDAGAVLAVGRRDLDGDERVVEPQQLLACDGSVDHCHERFPL